MTRLLLGATLASAAWQAVVVLRQGGAGSLRVLLIVVGLLVSLAGAVALARRLGSAFLWMVIGTGSAGVLWTTVLDLWVGRGSPHALGLMVLAALAMIHIALVVLANGTSRASWMERVVRRGALVTAVLASLLVAVEALYRVRVPLHTYELVPDQAGDPPCLRRAPDGRTRATPGYRGHWIHPEFDGTRVEINAWGLRDGLDEARPPEEGATSILVLGDSFVFGLGVALEDTFHERLEARLARSTKEGALPPRVYGAGIPGYGPGESRAMLAELEERVRPDVVVIGIYEGNDFQDHWSWLRRRPRDRREHESRGALRNYLDAAVRFPFWAASCATVRMHRATIESFLVARGWMSPLLHTNMFLSECLRREPSPDIDRMQALLLEELEALRKEVEGLGARLVVLVIPSAVQAEPLRFSQYVEIQTAAESGAFLRTAFHEAFVERLERRAFSVIDALPPLEESASKGLSGYHAEGHWNAEGHSTAARILETGMHAAR